MIHWFAVSRLYIQCKRAVTRTCLTLVPQTIQA